MTGNIAALGEEIARHRELTARDCAELFRALASVAARVEIGLWDAYECQKIVRALSLSLRPTFADCVRAYQGGDRP